MKKFFGLRSDHSSQSNDYHRQPQAYSQPAYQQPTPSATTRFRAIQDRFTNLEEVQHELRRNGLESSNLIVGLDFTKSNEWTGKYSFQGKSLHAVTPSGNPYEEVTDIIGRTLSVFDDDQQFPIFGFGDASTNDHSVFSFFQHGRPANGLDEALARYRQICPLVRLAGPTSFAPIIREAMRIVIGSHMQYQILLIIADGQVTRSADIADGQLSPQERDTVEAIVAASHLPLSIIMIGVGDGPWDVMQQFDDALPTRRFDNFQFVDFAAVKAETASEGPSRKDAMFALRSLMEIPDQFKEIMRLGLVGANPPSPHFYEGLRAPLPPPPPVADFDARQAATPSPYSTQSSFGAQTGNPYAQASLPHTQSSYPGPYQQGAAPSFGHNTSFGGGGGGPQFGPSPSFGGEGGVSHLSPNPSFGGGAGPPGALGGTLSGGGGFPPVLAFPPAGIAGGTMGGGYPSSLQQQQQSHPQGLQQNATYPQVGGSTGSGYPPMSGSSGFLPSGASGYPSTAAGQQASGQRVASSLETRQANRPDVPEPLYLCPITQDVMDQPHILAGDGYSYEKSAITEWLSAHDSSPMTSAKLDAAGRTLIPNNALRSAIKDWQSKHPQAK